MIGDTSYKVPFDSDQCFFIQDFIPGDSIIAWRRGVRTKGVVQKTDSGSAEVLYRTASGTTAKATLDNIIFLKPFDRNWLTS